MAESIKRPKLALRDILEEIAEDENFSEEERILARDKVREMEYEEWCSRQMKSNR